jgi:hypothetical protein
MDNIVVVDEYSGRNRISIFAQKGKKYVIPLLTKRFRLERKR